MEEVSVSKLQREMRLGYNKAAKIVERMEREGVVGPPNGVKPRQVLIRPVGEAHPDAERVRGGAPSGASKPQSRTGTKRSEPGGFSNSDPGGASSCGVMLGS
ncbi:hypothetical protein AMYX_22710 [Anaeromyxobacter diazotrophicus]|uniref:FtsK gamma domain-containing protein n=1 Tax=Anaeromyxobacter diazotrophicus TaxID=2590199 RepID=A0A7I9VN30_9BACT|nr:hypothetical protein AMYX_22710 [Anaeromyxobacter diazotrophicus]